MSDQQMDGLTDELAKLIHSSDPDDRPALSKCLVTARAYLAPLLKGHDVPEVVVDDCTLSVAADLWQARDARNGIVSIGDADGIEPFRISSDPLRSARPKLRAVGIPAGMGIA